MHWVHAAAFVVVTMDWYFFEESTHEPLWLAGFILAIAGTCRQVMSWGATMGSALMTAIAYILVSRLA